jgi:hypothetical protein
VRYDPSRQRRVSFIRSRGKEQLDALLLPIAQLVQEITPCSLERFNSEFDKRSREILGSNLDEKTIANFRTEIVRSLFGLVVFTATEARASERLERLLDSFDQTAFFKEIAFRFQFPFGGASKKNWDENQDLSLRPGPFIIQLLLLAQSEKSILSRDEIYYYVLNSADVQQGKAKPNEVLEAIVEAWSSKKAPLGYPIADGSFNRQHLKEFLDFLELGMLIVIQDDRVWLRSSEVSAIDRFRTVDACKVEFLDSGYATHDELRCAWDLFYTSIDAEFAVSGGVEHAATDSVQLPTSTVPSAERHQPRVPNVEIGRQGEMIVMDFERRRLSLRDRALLVKLVDRTAERHIGYDIQSARADLEDASHDYDELIYIEVKTTRRLTRVTTVEHDVFNMTRNEWNKAKESRSSYYLYRVYLTAEGTQIARLCDPFGKVGIGLRALPTNFEIQLDRPENEIIDLNVLGAANDS